MKERSPPDYATTMDDQKLVRNMLLCVIEHASVGNIERAKMDQMIAIVQEKHPGVMKDIEILHALRNINQKN